MVCDFTWTEMCRAQKAMRILFTVGTEGNYIVSLNRFFKNEKTAKASITIILQIDQSNNFKKEKLKKKEKKRMKKILLLPSACSNNTQLEEIIQ